MAPLSNSMHPKHPHHYAHAHTHTQTHSLFSTLRSLLLISGPPSITPSHQLHNSSSHSILVQPSYFNNAICIRPVCQILFSKDGHYNPFIPHAFFPWRGESVFPPLKSRRACDNGRSDTTWLSKLHYTRQHGFCLVLLRHLL